MSFLSLNGWAIELAPDSGRQRYESIDVPTRSEMMVSQRRPRRGVTGWSFRTVPCEPDVANAVECLVDGVGHSWTFDESLFSSRGRAPASTSGAAIVSGGDHLSCMEVSTSISWDLTRGIYPIDRLWTILVSRLETAVWHRYVVRSDGAKWLDGVRNDALSTTWLTMVDGTLTITDTAQKYDEMHCYACEMPDAAIESFYAYQTTVDALPALPGLAADGDFITPRLATVIGRVEAQPLVQLAASGGTWVNSGRVVPFALMARRVEPVSVISVAAPIELSLGVDAEATVSSPFSPAPLAYYTMAAITGGGTTIVDDTGNGHTMLTSGGTLVAGGRTGNALRALVASSGHTITIASAALMTGSTWSVSMWVKVLSPFVTSSVFSGSRYGGGSSGYGASVVNLGATYRVTGNGATTYTSASLIHVMCYGDGASGHATNARINNGALFQAVSGGLQNRDTSFVIHLLRQSFGAAMDGEVSEVAFFNVILDATQTTAIYNRGLASQGLL